MRATIHSYCKLSIAAVVFCLAMIYSALMTGQPASRHIVGVPDDWTHHHVVFSDPGTYEQAIANGAYPQWIKLQYDTRYILQQMKRNGAEAGGYIPGAETAPSLRIPLKPPPKPKALKRDWSMNMGAGATVGVGQYPAKWSFSTTTANCGSATYPDFVVYNTGLAGSGTQASVMAYDNLYAGCTGAHPLIYWQYNANAGQVVTSPVLSLDGSQVAFVESVGTAASLVLLKPLQGASAVGCLVQLSSAARSFTATTTSGSTTLTSATGCFNPADVGAGITGTGIQAGATISTVTNSTTVTLSAKATATGAPTVSVTDANSANGVVTNANYRACTAPCMTSITFTATGTPTPATPNDTTSSPYYDYANDVVYAGDSNGYLHKFTNLFNSGTPTDGSGGGATSGWPQLMAQSQNLTSPVLDPVSTNIFVGPESGAGGRRFHYIPAIGGSSNIVSSNSLAATNSTGVVDAPLVDSAAGMVYVFVNDDTAGANAAVYQFTTTFSGSTGTGASGPGGNEVTLGQGATTGNLYSGTFDNTYYSSSNGASPVGNLYVCGRATGSQTPTLWRVPVGGTGSTLSAAVVGPALATAPTDCSPIMEFLNGSTDYIFLSVKANNQAAAPISCPSGNGCLMAFTVTNTTGWSASTATSATALEAGGTSGIIIDNAVGSGTLAGASQVYFSPLGNQACAGNGTTGSGTGGCAIQASQAALQ